VETSLGYTSLMLFIVIERFKDGDAKPYWGEI
jgi:hypothetical protein